MNALEVIRTILSLMPLIINAIDIVEKMLPQGGNGAQKLDLVKTMLQAGYQTAEGSVNTFEQIWPSIKGVIDKIVAVYNAIGVFKKS